MSAGANKWVILLWGIAPALAVGLLVLAVRIYDMGHPWPAGGFAAAGLIVAVLRWIWR